MKNVAWSYFRVGTIERNPHPCVERNPLVEKKRFKNNFNAGLHLHLAMHLQKLPQHPGNQARPNSDKAVEARSVAQYQGDVSCNIASPYFTYFYS